MEITFQVERRDYLDYNKFAVSRLPALKRQGLLRLLFLPALLALEFQFLHLSLLVCVLLILVITAGWTAFLLWGQRRGVIALAEARPGAIGLHTLALGPEGFQEQSSVMATIVKWPKVTEITESKELIVLFLGPRYGFLVPKRAFQTSGQAQVFLETVRAYHKGALDGTAPLLPDAASSWPPPPQRMA